MSLSGIFFVFMPVFAFKAGKPKQNLQKATFAGGGFWCLECTFSKLPGVVEVKSGYIVDNDKNLTYTEVKSGKEGYREGIEVIFDGEKTNYKTLLREFWMEIDPTDAGGQFYDRGQHYTSAIYYHNDEQKKAAEKTKKDIEITRIFYKPIVTQIVPAGKFFKAEEKQQGYCRKNPLRYRYYRFSSGRESFIKKSWGRGKNCKTFPTPELKKFLTPLQYKVTQECETEPAFDNEYWDNYKDGLYVDIVSGEPLFSSLDKFDAKTGWPSFSKPLEPLNIVENRVSALGAKRIEVQSRQAGSHLGFVFDDGPKPGGLRYCINSASLRFIAKEDLGKEGFGQYDKLFK
ncbi:MAG: peptide-methionine (R)-S-oxide reductase MsrB [Elusimicrobia bacterium]|nr:peptide-methionine (R)-S-oxide reductase MsrB [Candidatus Liberimonas magnetica]